jgi:hypothetical protein
MLVVSEAARAYLAKRLAEIWAPEEGVVRFSLEDDAVAMEPGIAGPNDTRFEYSGRTVLVLDVHASEALANKTLDVLASEDGDKLVFGDQKTPDAGIAAASSGPPVEHA